MIIIIIVAPISETNQSCLSFQYRRATGGCGCCLRPCTSHQHAGAAEWLMKNDINIKLAASLLFLWWWAD